MNLTDSFYFPVISMAKYQQNSSCCLIVDENRFNITRKLFSFLFSKHTSSKIFKNSWNSTIRKHTTWLQNGPKTLTDSSLKKMNGYQIRRQLSSKEFACQCRGCRFDPWVRKIPCRNKWQLTPVFLPGKSNG